MAFVIKTDGTEERMPVGKLTLELMQKAVGGYIERVLIGRQGEACYCNEDGKILGLRLNPKATMRAGHGHDPLRGDVLFLSAAEERLLETDPEEN